MRPVIAARLIFDKTGSLSADMRRNVWEAITKTAADAEKDVKGGPHSLYKAYPPVPGYDRTGNLGRSYNVQYDQPNLRAVLGNDPGVAPYAVYVEMGTERMAAKPHLKPSVEAVKDVWNQRMKDALKG